MLYMRLFKKNKPLIQRVVTVTGNAARKHANFLVRVGTPIEYLIEHAGGCLRIWEN